MFIFSPQDNARNQNDQESRDIANLMESYNDTEKKWALI